MDRDSQLFLGQILGQVFRVQKRLGMAVPVSDQEIYGLVSRIENVSHELLEQTTTVSLADLAAVREVLDSYYPTEEKAEKFKGFYDIERVLGKGRRVEILKALRYLNAGGEYEELMAKIDSEHSPSECRKLAPHEDET